MERLDLRVSLNVKSPIIKNRFMVFFSLEAQECYYYSSSLHWSIRTWLWYAVCRDFLVCLFLV